jgi:ribose/xylose/arabinose/galactoside ABC-type transport system permease subunit
MRNEMLAAPRRDARSFNLAGLADRWGLLAFTVLLLTVAALATPSFLRPSNLQNLLTQAAPLGIVVLGQTFVLLVRGLDLSVASTMATAAVVATAFGATSDAMIPAIFAVCIVFGLAVGAVNGLLVTKRRVSPFLATLAVMVVLQGARFAYTKGSNSGALPPGFRELGTGTILGLPINFVALVMLALALGALLHLSVFGRRVYVVGGNPRAATLCGIDADRITIACYMICGAMASMGGLFLVGYVGLVDNWTGRGYEVDSIVAAVMGGVALTGGRGTIFGALLGVLILVVLFNLVILLGLPVELQHIIKGIIIIAAAAFYVTRVSRLS